MSTALLKTTLCWTIVEMYQVAGAALTCPFPLGTVAPAAGQYAKIQPFEEDKKNTGVVEGDRFKIYGDKDWGTPAAPSGCFPREGKPMVLLCSGIRQPKGPKAPKAPKASKGAIPVQPAGGAIVVPPGRKAVPLVVRAFPLAPGGLTYIPETVGTPSKDFERAHWRVILDESILSIDPAEYPHFPPSNYQYRTSIAKSGNPGICQKGDVVVDAEWYDSHTTFTTTTTAGPLELTTYTVPPVGRASSGSEATDDVVKWLFGAAVLYCCVAGICVALVCECCGDKVEEPKKEKPKKEDKEEPEMVLPPLTTAYMEPMTTSYAMPTTTSYAASSYAPTSFASSSYAMPMTTAVASPYGAPAYGGLGAGSFV